MLFFIHVPKAAGTSLRKALIAALGDRLVPAYPEHPTWNTEFAVAKAEALRADAVIFGHNEWGLHERFKKPPQYAAVLRHPVERIVSWYRWQATHPHLQYYQTINAGLSLCHMIDTGMARDLSNDMTAFIAGTRPRDLTDHETLARAKKNLRTFKFVSFAEGLFLDLQRLNKLLGASVARLPRENVSNPRSVDEETRALILKHNALDLELYRLACRIAESRNPNLRGL